jgi:acyl-CoA reductase-like NAD-dependent aldehyde dehydrogenase
MPRTRPVSAPAVGAGSPLLGSTLIDAARLEALGALAVAGPERPWHQTVVPATGEPLGRLPMAAPTDVAEAVAVARAAQPAWA